MILILVWLTYIDKTLGYVQDIVGHIFQLLDILFGQDHLVSRRSPELVDAVLELRVLSLSS